MGRERLMQQQRARMEARRARLKKKKADMKKYGSGSKKGVTRDTSKDQSKKTPNYASGSKKGVTRNTSLDQKPKAVTPKAALAKSKTGAAVLGLGGSNVKKGTLTKKPTGSGVTGKSRKSNPPSPTVTAKPKAGSRARVKKEDPRETGRKRNLREANAAKARRERKEQFTKKPYGGMASSPPKNPKEGDMYKKPFGPVMIYKNGKFVRK